jgi:hypothetical protein
MEFAFRVKIVKALEEFAHDNGDVFFAENTWLHLRAKNRGFEDAICQTDKWTHQIRARATRTVSISILVALFDIEEAE